MILRRFAPFVVFTLACFVACERSNEGEPSRIPLAAEHEAQPSPAPPSAPDEDTSPESVALVAEVARISEALVRDLLNRDIASLAQKVTYPLELRTQGGTSRCPSAQSADDLPSFVECVLGPRERAQNDAKNLRSLSARAYETRPELEQALSPIDVEGNEQGPFGFATYHHSGGSRGFVFAFRRGPLALTTIWTSGTTHVDAVSSPEPPADSASTSAQAACELELSTKAVRRGHGYDVTALARNKSAKPVHLELPNRCPQGAVVFTGLSQDYDFYQSCAKGACAGPRKPVAFDIKPGEQIELEAVTIEPEGGNCTTKLPRGSHAITFAVPFAGKSCFGATAKIPGPPN